MKSYSNLWEKIISTDVIKLAIQSACKNISGKKNKKKRNKLIEILTNINEYIPTVRKWIEDFQPYKHTTRIINDGISAKQREIICPNVKEMIICHAVIIVMKPLLTKGMYEHTYASIPKRGCHKGMKRICKWIKKDPYNTKYCEKLDIKKFFPSISQDYLICKFKKVIRDEKFMNLLTNLIRTTEKGLPLGFFTSQWFANYLLQELDHYIKEDLKVKYLIRFMDDMVLFGSNKRKLHKIRIKIEEKLSSMGLSLKENWQIFKMHTLKGNGRFLDFMGFKFYRNKITMRKKICLKAMRKAKKISKKKNITIYDARQMMTYIGWMKYTDSHNWYLNYIKPYVKIKKLKKIISDYDKRRKKLCGKNHNQQLCQS